ncbi:hypothetical protein OTSGILL_0134 [Orientia tsutsugamushi str. Gilliam]|uniref:Uncharacterized protein n=1 Tax=Orientia tsutsugamushi str. Gilliam TaxID=1359184 RepID=A0A0F3MEI9_ORITS|nr:hypothetical protein [Orientia tsutsugamushi]KJV54183.1 hypothetical protein OTSGILL_0134 [Orientia tsutsugamushi str. Gilliam]SPR02448.1 Uncharacterised protein [Orientia tsutsugamushi str. Gilliam]
MNLTNKENCNIEHLVQDGIKKIKENLPPLTEDQQERLKAFDKNFLNLFKRQEGKKKSKNLKSTLMYYVTEFVDFVKTCISCANWRKEQKVQAEYDVYAFARGVEKALEEIKNKKDNLKATQSITVPDAARVACTIESVIEKAQKQQQSYSFVERENNRSKKNPKSNNREP